MRVTPILICLALLLIGAQAGPGAADSLSCRDDPSILGTARTAVIGDEGPVELGLKTYPRTLRLADHEVVLTFDDGPSRSTTPLILDALKKDCVHATFFLIGRNAGAAPQLVRREIAEGHTVGHHTFSHPEITLRGMADGAARADIDRGFAADDKAGYGRAEGGPRVPFFRFPGFADTAALDAWLATRHIAIFGADLWASDWIPMTPGAELKLLLGRLDAVGRGIILLHDIKPQTAAMLPAFLQALKDRHYKVVQIVPGHGTTETVDAAPGWKAETERTIAALWPKLVKLGARSPMPAGETDNR